MSFPAVRIAEQLVDLRHWKTKPAVFQGGLKHCWCSKICHAPSTRHFLKALLCLPVLRWLFSHDLSPVQPPVPPKLSRVLHKILWLPPHSTNTQTSSTMSHFPTTQLTCSAHFSAELLAQLPFFSTTKAKGLEGTKFNKSCSFPLWSVLPASEQQQLCRLRSQKNIHPGCPSTTVSLSWKQLPQRPANHSFQTREWRSTSRDLPYIISYQDADFASFLIQHRYFSSRVILFTYHFPVSDGGSDARHDTYSLWASRYTREETQCEISCCKAHCKVTDLTVQSNLLL